MNTTCTVPNYTSLLRIRDAVLNDVYAQFDIDGTLAEIYRRLEDLTQVLSDTLPELSCEYFDYLSREDHNLMITDILAMHEQSILRLFEPYARGSYGLIDNLRRYVTHTVSIRDPLIKEYIMLVAIVRILVPIFQRAMQECRLSDLALSQEFERFFAAIGSRYLPRIWLRLIAFTGEWTYRNLDLISIRTSHHPGGNAQLPTTLLAIILTEFLPEDDLDFPVIDEHWTGHSDSFERFLHDLCVNAHRLLYEYI